MRPLSGMIVLVANLIVLAPLQGQEAGPPAEERRLMKEKLETAQKELDVSMRELGAKRFDAASLLPAFQRCIDAGLDFHPEPADRVKLLEDLTRRARALEEDLQARLKGGIGSERDLLAVRYMRLDAELRLVRERKKIK